MLRVVQFTYSDSRSLPSYVEFHPVFVQTDVQPKIKKTSVQIFKVLSLYSSLLSGTLSHKFQLPPLLKTLPLSPSFCETTVFCVFLCCAIVSKLPPCGTLEHFIFLLSVICLSLSFANSCRISLSRFLVVYCGRASSVLLISLWSVVELSLFKMLNPPILVYLLRSSLRF